MDLTEEIREEVTMRGNIKITENKTGDDSTETENSDKSRSNKRSEPLLDKPNPKYMKITLPLSKRDATRRSSDLHASYKCFLLLRNFVIFV